MKTRRDLIAIALCTILASAGCGGSGGGSGTVTPPNKNITISGTLMAGSVDALARFAESAASPFAADQLYCVTFSSPPVSGSATADNSGNVSLTLAALNVPFGCFILSPSSTGAATLFFNASSTSGETVTFGGDANLGTITVDTSTGMATATLPQGGSLTGTPAGVACPVGTWSVTIGTYTCDSSCTNGCTVGSTQTGTSTVWIAQSATDQYTASFTHIGCNSGSQSDVPATYTGGVFTLGPWSEPDATCSHSVTAMVTPNGACTSTTSATSSWTNCGSCGTGDNVCVGCGTLTCNGTIETMSKQ